MDFPNGTAVVRLRATVRTDPYSNAQTRSDWAAPDRLSISGAFVASSSSSPAAGELRSGVVTYKSLYCAPDQDVRVGDRIVSGSHTYEVAALPEADVNPFTGWQPVQEIPLTEVLG